MLLIISDNNNDGGGGGGGGRLILLAARGDSNQHNQARRYDLSSNALDIFVCDEASRRQSWRFLTVARQAFF